MSKDFKLWSGKKIIPDKLPILDNVTNIMVHRAQKGHFQFLLGADIIQHNGVMFCGWGNSKIDENDSASIMGGRRSLDDGLTWSDFEIIAPGSNGEEANSHGVFFSNQHKLYAFVPRAEYKVRESTYPNLCTELFLLDEQSDQWKSEGVIIDEKPFWPMNRPLALENGNFIMPGLICKDNRAEPAVAISTGNNIKQLPNVKILGLKVD